MDPFLKCPLLSIINVSGETLLEVGGEINDKLKRFLHGLISEDPCSNDIVIPLNLRLSEAYKYTFQH
jgi:hypothetical protein